MSRDRLRDQIHDRIKVLVLGDSGVGKSSFVNLICKGQAYARPNWTIGATIEVVLHQFKEGTPDHRSCFIELWDIGGYKSHDSARQIFYQNFHGIILVHDLSNQKSYANLRHWLTEVFCATEGYHQSDTANFEFDTELFAPKNIPALIIGTKKDQQVAFGTNNRPRQSLAEGIGADDININCLDSKSFAPATNNSIKLSRFFDKVVEKKYNWKFPRQWTSPS